MLDFACSFSQFPFAPLFCLSCILCIYTIRHALDIWAKKRKKISNCVISKCIFSLYIFITFYTRWNGLLQIKLLIANTKKRTYICCTLYTRTIYGSDWLNYWMDSSLKLSVVALNHCHKCSHQRPLFILRVILIVSDGMNCFQNKTSIIL